MATTDTYIASGYWVCPPNVTSITLEAWGAGGGGGGDGDHSFYSYCGGGGGGGAYSKLNTLSVTPGTRYQVTVGTGGTGGANLSNGTAGGDSWFSTSGTVLAKGGGGGTTSCGGGSAGASASGIGDTKYSGGTGGAGDPYGYYAGSGAGGAGDAANGSNGKYYYQGAGAGGSTGGGDGSASVGSAGNVRGGGGCGNSASGAGSNGARGEVRVTYSFSTDPTDSYSTANYDTDTQLWNQSGFSSERGQSFTGDGKTLTSASFVAYKSSGADGTLTCYLYAHDGGTFGTNGLPTGAALATSATVAVSSLTTTAGLLTFTFSGGPVLTNATKYFIVFKITGNTTGAVYVGIDTSSATHAGNAYAYINGTGAVSSANDTSFYVFAILPPLVNKFFNFNTRAVNRACRY